MGIMYRFSIQFHLQIHLANCQNTTYGRTTSRKFSKRKRIQCIICVFTNGQTITIAGMTKNNDRIPNVKNRSQSAENKSNQTCPMYAWCVVGCTHRNR